MIYHGISQKIDEAITEPQGADIKLLKELVQYYKDNYILSAAYLDEKLNILINQKC